MRNRPAFPIPDQHHRIQSSPGMTLHQYYIGQAIAAGMGPNSAVSIADEVIALLEKRRG